MSRMNGFRLTLAIMGLCLSGGAMAQDTNDMAAMMKALGGGLSGKALRTAIDKAATFPLGSQDNPVRANGPEGQRAYLSRLRCADGKAPAFARGGSVGMGVFGYIVDVYGVTCPGSQAEQVYIDMYHRHREDSAPPGFTMARPIA
ncbi:hypothetical protein [Sphingomonas sp. VDB2]|uniref:hypothetical protein n=1 Tax=Sphingomonas sp. VDB2 TaxID=3228751 RepID=UPI003A804940